MNKFKNSLAAVAGLAMLAVAIPLLMPLAGLGSNASGGTAPTTQTQNVNVVNTPSVNSQQSGTWNVGINGTPTVSIAAGGTVGLAPQNNTVKIDNSSPVAVRDVDNPARQPFQANFQFFIQDGSFGSSQSLIVPAGKQLVIEYISADSGVPTGQLARIGLYTSINGQFSLHYVVTNRLGAVGNGDDEFVAGQPTTIYADQGTEVQVGFSKNAGQGFANCSVTLSGHFVDAL